MNPFKPVRLAWRDSIKGSTWALAAQAFRGALQNIKKDSYLYSNLLQQSMAQSATPLALAVITVVFIAPHVRDAQRHKFPSNCTCGYSSLPSCETVDPDVYPSHEHVFNSIDCLPDVPVKYAPIHTINYP